MSKFDYTTMTRAKLNNRVNTIGATLGKKLPVAINEVIQGALYWLQHDGQGDTTALSNLLTTLQQNRSREVKQVKVALKAIAPFLTAKYDGNADTYTVGAKGWNKEENAIDVSKVRDYREYETPDSEKKETTFNIDKRIQSLVTMANKADVRKGATEKMAIVNALISEDMTPERLAKLYTVAQNMYLLDELEIVDNVDNTQSQAA